MAILKVPALVRPFLNLSTLNVRVGNCGKVDAAQQGFNKSTGFTTIYFLLFFMNHYCKINLIKQQNLCYFYNNNFIASFVVIYNNINTTYESINIHFPKLENSNPNIMVAYYLFSPMCQISCCA